MRKMARWIARRNSCKVGVVIVPPPLQEEELESEGTNAAEEVFCESVQDRTPTPVIEDSYVYSEELEDNGIDDSMQRIIHQAGLSVEYFHAADQNQGSSSWSEETLSWKYEGIRRRRELRKWSCKSLRI
ncbi:uncharacterized protein LOC135689038 [Rhopilema esculentum]|uniref:uncharacterized protein LOC135689038 n=1 Tax=Rhopilema esculentum TaxID=499914 RepID=UPI0031D752F7